MTLNFSHPGQAERALACLRRDTGATKGNRGVTSAGARAHRGGRVSGRVIFLSPAPCSDRHQAGQTPGAPGRQGPPLLLMQPDHWLPVTLLACCDLGCLLGAQPPSSEPCSLTQAFLEVACHSQRGDTVTHSHTRAPRGQGQPCFFTGSRNVPGATPGFLQGPRSLWSWVTYPRDTAC